MVVGAVLLVRNLPVAGTFFGFYLAGTAYFGWANIILQRTGDDAVRNVTVYSMNIGSMVLWTFWGILFYFAADVPYWKKGSIALIFCCAVMFCYIWLTHYASIDIRQSLHHSLTFTSSAWQVYHEQAWPSYS